LKKHTVQEDQIRAKFVHTLMLYFKIDEDVFLKSHIDELIRPISVGRYKEFLHKLSSGNFEYKTGIEKISIIAHEMYEQSTTAFEDQAYKRTEKLAALMYDIRRDITSQKNGESSASERFENIRFTTIKTAGSSEPLLDSIDIDVIKTLTKKRIYDYVSNDNGLFKVRVNQEYFRALLDQERMSRQPLISAETKKALVLK
jgi:hypothetical protein